MELRYRLKPGVKPGEFEYAAAYLSGNVLQGAILRSTDDLKRSDARNFGRAASWRDGRNSPTAYFRRFRDLELKTRIGGLRVAFEGVAPLSRFV